MKYILKKNIPASKVSGVSKEIAKALEDGKPFKVDVLPRNLIGRVEEVQSKPKKIKKEIE